jgi:hypothetical protein
MSDLANIADAVTTMISGASLGADFTAIRTYSPVYDPTTDTGIKVFVVPISLTMADMTRNTNELTYTVMIGIYNSINYDEYNSLDKAEIDSMLSFSANVCSIFLNNNKVANPDAFLIDITNDPAFDPQSLDQHNVFATVIELKYKLIK